MEISIKVEIRLTTQEWQNGADKVLRDQPYEWNRTIAADPDTLTAFCITLNTAMQQLAMTPGDTTPDEPEWPT